jgi:hypothetical protein
MQLKSVPTLPHQLREYVILERKKTTNLHHLVFHVGIVSFGFEGEAQTQSFTPGHDPKLTEEIIR